MSHDLLDDLLADVPRHVVPDAVDAWRAGRSRRRRRYAAGGLALAAAVALVGAGLVRLHDHTPVAPANPSETISGHPREVPRPWREQALPDRSGPLAGALRRDGDWFGVDQNGRSWRLPTDVDQYPALSADGRIIGQLVPDGPDRASYETVDLSTGERVAYESVGNGIEYKGRALTDQPYWAAMQHPSYWSPDGARLLLPGGRIDSERPQALLLEHGVVHELAVRGFPVGWVSPTRIAWLAYDGSRVRITDLTGAVVREVELFPDEPLRELYQWSGRVSPDGRRVAVLERPGSGQSRVWTFSLGDGTPDPAAPTMLAVTGHPTCPLMWHEGEVAVWAFDGLHDITSGDTVIEPQGWGDSTCGTWTDDALAGPAQPGPGWLEWRYWPAQQSLPWILATTFGVIILAVPWWVRRRRRRAMPAPWPTPGAPSEPSSG
jgi:hypothetical protein